MFSFTLRFNVTCIRRASGWLLGVNLPFNWGDCACLSVSQQQLFIYIVYVVDFAHGTTTILCVVLRLNNTLYIFEAFQISADF